MRRLGVTRRTGPEQTGAQGMRARLGVRTPSGLSSKRGFPADPGRSHHLGGHKGDLDLSTSGLGDPEGRRPGLLSRTRTGGVASGSIA